MRLLTSFVAFALVLGTVAPAGARDHKKKKGADTGSGMQPVDDGDAPVRPVKPAPPADAAKGELVSLTVASSTPGASVYVDGEQLGVTPMDLPVPVTPGDHSLKVTKLGYAPYIDVFSTKGKKDVKLELELVPVSGVLHVKSNVPGARVMIDGRYVGDAPLDVEADVGPRAVQLSKGCYQDFFQNVMAVAGQEIALDASLVDLPDDKNPCKPPPPEPPRWYKKGWVWGVVAAGAVVVAGGIAAGVYFGQATPPDVELGSFPK